MYYFRDCYFDQQLAFGVARASLTPPYGSRPKKRSSSRQGSALDYVTPFVCIGLTFGAGFVVLDVLGLEHLAEPPSFEGLAGYAEYVRTAAIQAYDKIPPIFLAG